MSLSAAVLCTGDELLRGFVHESNAYYLAGELRDAGVELRTVRLCSDDLPDIQRELATLATEVDLVITSGGLGPTHDDRTAEAVANVVAEPLQLDHAALEMVRARVAVLAAARGNDPAGFEDGNIKQATLPRGAHVLEPAGTAPGFVVRHPNGAVIVVLPGPPGELRAGWERAKISAPDVRRVLAGGADLHERLVRVWGVPESHLATMLAELDHTDSDAVRATLCAREGELELSVRGQQHDRVDALVDAVCGRLGERIFALDDEAPVGALVGRQLMARGATLVTVESCTGGLVGVELTSIPGASQWYKGGAITYADAMKEVLVNVPAQLIKDHGAVSDEVACAMAAGGVQAFGADYAVAITGIAGPGGDRPGKPVGTVWIAVADASDSRARLFTFVGDRTTVRRRSSIAAQHLLLHRLTRSDS